MADPSKLHGAHQDAEDQKYALFQLSETSEASCSYFPLLTLADELILAVIEQIDSHEALVNLAATSRRLQDLVEPRIWRSLVVKSGSDAWRFSDACRRIPERMALVHELSIRYMQQEEQGIDRMNPLISQLPKLRSFRVETPCPNDGSGGNLSAMDFFHYSLIDYTRIFEQAVGLRAPHQPLSMLQSVTIHAHRSSEEPFYLGGAAAIFLHPTLRKLSISCADFEANIKLSDIPESKLKSTKLESLTFIECNVYLPLLEVALSLPQALKKLRINERQHIWMKCRPSHILRTTHPKFLVLLQKQASSLECLVHNSGKLSNTTDIQRLDEIIGYKPETEHLPLLRTLTSLKYLEVSLGNGYIAECFKTGGFPSSLETLRLNDSSYSTVHAYCTTEPRNYRVLPRLGHKLAIASTAKPLNLELCYVHGYGPGETFQMWWNLATDACKENRLKVYEIALVLKSRGARMRIFVEQFKKGTPYIPPYMYGEEEPTERLLYDSKEPFVFDGVDNRKWDCKNVIPEELLAGVDYYRSGDTSLEA